MGNSSCRERKREVVVVLWRVEMWRGSGMEGEGEERWWWWRIEGEGRMGLGMSKMM